MYFKKLKLQNFRNLENADIELKNGLNVFEGLNAQGKTNLLEALFILSSGKTFRPADNETLILRDANHSREFARLEGIAYRGECDYEINLIIEKDRKKLTINGKKQGSHALRKIFPCVLFSPESLQAIKEGPEQRRSLVDDFLVTQDPHQSLIVSEFRKSLMARNRVLRNMKEGKIQQSQGLDVLDSLERPFLERATELSYARIEILKNLMPFVEKSLQAVLSQENVDISVDYLISNKGAWHWSKTEIFNAMQNRIRELRTSECDSGTTLVGPHKHDIRFIFEGKDARYFCSQGQQRALILSYKMAQIRYHYQANRAYPVLLLDDVLSELDQEKRAYLVKFLVHLPTQIVLTTTELDLPGTLRENDPFIFEVKNGRVRRAS